MQPDLDFKNLLNSSQYDAVTYLNGPILVVAGAGTGKTRIIEYRVLNLIRNDIKPASILLLTFTRKAAREMIDRASQHNKMCRQVEGGTFHSFAYRVIRVYRKHLGFNDSISFLDEGDAADALHLIATRLGLLDKKIRFPKKDTLKSIISMSINRSQNIRSVLEKEYPHFMPHKEDLERLHKEYIQYKHSKQLVDFDDMLIYLKFLLEKEEVLERVASKFQYVMVDEFQDTNKLQADIIYLLGKRHKNVMAVGDDAQSIYSFRGAYCKNMFDFPKRFADCKVIKLEHNYRSTQPILDVANAVIEAEKEQYTKVLFTVNKGGDAPALNFFKDTYGEAEYIADKIKSFYDNGMDFSAFGILYRSNHHSLPLQLALSKNQIPFVVYGGIRFVETAHVKDALSFLKIAQNYYDELAWNRVLMLLEGIGPKTAGHIYESLMNLQSTERAFAQFSDNPKYKNELKKLHKLYGEIKEKGLGICDKLSLIREFYYPLMKKKFDDYHIRNDDLKALIQISSEYKDAEEFLVDFVALEPPERSVAGILKRSTDDKQVVLSTIHSAKGLEWDTVFIISLMEGCLPSSYSLEDEDSLAEERRLLYVAITRAKRRLFLSMHSQGRNGGIFSFERLSRFINEKKVLDKLKVNYREFKEWHRKGYDEFDSIDVNEDSSAVLRRMYDYFDY